MFKKHEIEKLTRLADAVKVKDAIEEKQDYSSETNKAREYVKAMKDIANQIQGLRSKYIQFEREFNKLLGPLLFSKADKNTKAAFTELVAKLVEYDKVVGLIK